MRLGLSIFIILLLTVSIGSFAVIGSQHFRAEVSNDLSSRISEALSKDPALIGVEPVFDGLNGFLDGIVADQDLWEQADQTAKDVLPAGQMGENRVSLANRSPHLKVTFNEGAVILEGEVSDEVVSGGLMRTISELEEVSGVESKLKVELDVRRVRWLPNFINFLPRLMQANSQGSAEVTDEKWKLVAELSSPEKREELASAWRAIVPNHAEPALDQLTAAAPEPRPDPTTAAMAALAAAEAAIGDPLDELERLLTQYTVFFPSNSSYMTDGDKERLIQAANAIRAFEDFELEVVGYADNVGDADYNKWLTGKRATRVKDALAARGVAVNKTRIVTAGSEIDSESKTDRRVELQLIRENQP